MSNGPIHQFFILETKGEIILFMKKLVSALNDGNIFYYPFKYGYFSEYKKMEDSLLI